MLGDLARGRANADGASLGRAICQACHRSRSTSTSALVTIGSQATDGDREANAIESWCPVVCELGRLGKQRGARLRRQHLRELGARADAELGEDLAQVVLDRVLADEEPRADLAVRKTVAGKPRDLRLLRG
jgi:hypothetical protein